MEKHLHNIDELFTKGLEQLEAPPSEKVWKGVEQSLSNEDYESIKKKYDRLKYLLLLLLLLFTASTFYLINKNSPADKNQNDAVAKANPANIGQQSPATSLHQQVSLQKPTDETLTNTISTNQYNTPLANTQDGGKPQNDQSHFAMAKPVKNNADNDESQTTKNVIQPYTQVLNQPTAVDKKKDKDIVSNSSADASNVRVKEALAPARASATVTAATAVPKETEAVSNQASEKVNPYPMNNPAAPATAAKARKTNDTYSQGPDMDIATSFRFSVMPFAAINLSKPRIMAGSREYSSNDYLGIRSRENNGMQASVFKGALINYNLNDKWDIQSGVGFIKYDNTILPQTIYGRFDSASTKGYRLNFSSGTVYLRSSQQPTVAAYDSIAASTTNSTLKYAVIPVMAQYKIPRGNFIFTLQGGMYANVVTGQKLQTTLTKNGITETKTVDKIEGLRPVYFNMAAGTGMEYLLSNRVSLYASPVMLIPITSINKNTPARTTRAGFNFIGGVKLRF